MKVFYVVQKKNLFLLFPINSKKQFTRIVTFNRGTYFYKVRGGKSELKSGEENTVILASRVNSMFDVAMRYR